MGLFDWLFGNKKKSDEEKMSELSEHFKKEREKSIPKHRGNKFVRLQPRVVGAKKETTSKTKKTEKKSEKKKTNKPLRISWDETEDVGIVTQYKGKPFTGVCYELHENGEVEEECEMVKGLKHGKEQIFSTEGKLTKVISYKDDKKNGVSKVYRENGVLKIEANFKNDKREGISKMFDEDGELEKEAFYKNDILEKQENKISISKVLKDSQFEKYIEKFHENNIYTIGEYTEWKKAGINLKEIIPDEKERTYFGMFWLEKTILNTPQREHLPTAPIDEKSSRLKEDIAKVKYEFEKDASEFESIKEIIDFLKSDDDIKIRVEAYEEWDGFLQLTNDKKSDNIKHNNLYDENGDQIIMITEKDGKQEVSGDYSVDMDGNDYDMRKQTYEDTVYLWQNGFVDKDFLIDQLNEFVDEENDNLSAELHDFFDFLDMPQDVHEVMELFQVSDQTGNDDYSWHAESYINDNGVDLIFCK